VKKTRKTKGTDRAPARTGTDGKKHVEPARGRPQARDGALELAVSIASLCQAVRVDASAVPFQTDPADLFDRTFAGVGIGDEQMSLLREQLKLLLPEIAPELDENARVLDQPGHRIEAYGAFIRVALLLKLR